MTVGTTAHRATSSRSSRPEPRHDASPGITALAVSATALTLVGLWILLQALALGSLARQRVQDELYADLRGRLAAATAPVDQPIEPGSAVGVISVPRLSLEDVVVEGTTSAQTLVGPGHRRNTPLPGQAGVSVVLGRAAAYGGPFGGLGSLLPGDRIDVTTGLGVAHFTVRDLRRAGDPRPPAPPAGAARLTLVSAEGSGFLSALRPRTVVYVDADLQGSPFASGSGAYPPLTEAEPPMAWDPSALPMLTLCLAVLTGGLLGVLRLGQRFRAVQVWVVAAPILIAVLWVTTDALMRVLPNLL